MPDPTRAQFDEAAKKVIASAPPGLSREQFFDAITQHLKSSTPVDEPSTTGFLGNAMGDAMEVGGDMVPGAMHAIQHPIDTMTALPVAFLNRIVTMGKDMHPVDAAHKVMQGDFQGALGSALPVGELYKKPVTAAMDLSAGMSAVKGIKAIAGAAGDGADALAANRLNRNIPETGPKGGLRYDRHMPNKSAGAQGPVPEAPGQAPPYVSHEHNPIDIHSPNRSGYTGEPVGTAPGQFTGPSEAVVERYAPNKSGYNAEDALYESLMERMGGGGKSSNHAAQPDGYAPGTTAPTRPNFEERRRTDAQMEGGKRSTDPPASEVNANPKSDDSYTGRLATSEEPTNPNWHSGAEDPLEKAQASTLHAEDRGLNSRFQNIMDDESGSVPLGVGNLANVFLRHLVREGINSALPTIGGPIRKGLAMGKSTAKFGTEVANVGRVGNDR